MQAWANRQNGRRAEEGRLINSRALRVFFHWVAKGVDLFRKGDVIEIVAVPSLAWKCDTVLGGDT